MLKLRHFTRRLDDAAEAAPRRDPSGCAASGRDASIGAEWVGAECAAPTTGGRALLPSAKGRIRHVFMVASRRMPGFEQGMLERLLRLADGFSRISLAVHAADRAALDMLVRGLGLAATVDVIAAPEGAALWPWAQDRIAACRNADGSIAVLGSGDPDDFTADAAARACGAPGSVPLGLPLPGGNILVDGDVCFVGGDLGEAVIDTTRKIQVVACAPLERRGPERFQMTPGDYTWRQDIDRCIAAGGSRQPVFHIDMFMTLAGMTQDGARRILLGDPVWASELIGLPLPEGFPARAFQQIEYGLRLRGYEVLRNPLPFIYFDNEEAKLREWFYASANNCWVECMQGADRNAEGEEEAAEGEAGRGEASGCRVFLPEYGFGPWAALKATDDVNAEIWKHLGFEVVRGGDFLPLADQLGSLNCISRVLDRA